jgi:N-acetylneuraminic acid mutarotase
MSILDKYPDVPVPDKQGIAILLVFILICVGIGFAIGYFFPH